MGELGVTEKEFAALLDEKLSKISLQLQECDKMVKGILATLNSCDGHIDNISRSLDNLENSFNEGFGDINKSVDETTKMLKNKNN